MWLSQKKSIYSLITKFEIESGHLVLKAFHIKINTYNLHKNVIPKRGSRGLIIIRSPKVYIV